MPDQQEVAWKFQRQFYWAATEEAKMLFDELDENLKASVALVCVPCGESPGAFPVVEAPADSDYHASAFRPVYIRKDHYRRQYEQQHLRISGPDSDAVFRELLAYGTAVGLVATDIEKKSGMRPFYSSAAQVGGYLVFVVLRLSGDAYERHYSLPSHHNTGLAFPRVQSLPLATVQVFLSGCADALRRPQPGYDRNVLAEDPEDTLRRAGKLLVDGWPSRRRADERRLSLFNTIERIASSSYEGEHCCGSILIEDNVGHSSRTSVAFASDVTLAQTRKVRKLLETCRQPETCCQARTKSPALSLLMTRLGKIYGLGTVKKDLPQLKQPFEIRFDGDRKWEFRHGGHVLMRVEYGVPGLPKAKLDRDKLKSDLTRLFPGAQVDDIARLAETVWQAASAKHGTTIVISEEAKQEAGTLRSQCTPIEPRLLDEQLTMAVTAIDGAVFLDQQGKCHAIGAILHGPAPKKGNPARGSRYNSAVGYVEQQRDKDKAVCAFVFSQDGSVDMIPELKPQLRRSEIESRMEVLRSLRTSDSPSVREFSMAVGWLNDHRYYLTASQCEEINELKDGLATRFPPEPEGEFPPGCWPDFHPEPDWEPTCVTED